MILVTNKKFPLNLSLFDFILAYCNLIKNSGSSTFLHVKTYKNFYHVSKKIMKKDYPINSMLRNGKRVTINYYLQDILFINEWDKYCRFDGNSLIIEKNLSPAIFNDWENNGDLATIFFEGEYNFLSVEGNEVVDIGANIADSSIFFALKGAKKVIALEPFPKNFESAKKNIQLNNMDKKIDLILAGCGGKNDVMYVNIESKGVVKTLDKNEKNGLKIPILNLDKILERCKTESPLLKVDCEGCEYETILSTSRETLRRFGQIFIEYHFGYQNLKKKLESCGFRVRISGPKTGRQHYFTQREFAGNLYAEKI